MLGTVYGYSYTIQEELPGSPMEVVTASVLPGLLELNELQARLATSEERAWPGPVVDTVMVGGDGYCLLDSLRTYSPTTAELLTVLQAVVLAHRDEHFETNDVVHFDFNPSNILLENGQVSGVIDWEGACAGDCTFNLATLLFAEVLAFVRTASRLPGIKRLALIGSLTTEKADPKDADLLVTFTDAADLAPHAALGRKLQGHAQSMNKGGDGFLRLSFEKCSRHQQSCSKGQDISGSKDSWFPPERCYPVAGRNRTACVLLQKTSMKASP